IDAGDEILMPDPSYPCNRHFVSAAEGVATLIPTGAAERFQLSADQVAAHWGDKTRGVLLASPSNPTGTSIDPAELRSIHEVVQAKGGVTIVDEIYLGLSYEEAFGHSALAISDSIISINSFSKYFNMTGWRLGWMVVPEAMVPVVERMAQNLFICASTISQHAALACFSPESIAIFEERRAQFKARRDYFLPALRELGFGIDVMPDGAFYAWADCTALCEKLGVDNSWDFAYALMDKAHLAITPGRDFGTADTARYVRFSTANSMEQLQEAIRRMRKLFA
ncbi:MAG: aminotransferase class I/II-fold pyridoxal phosphate-dependent enzyme, partial [Comamonas sp.]